MMEAAVVVDLIVVKCQTLIWRRCSCVDLKSMEVEEGYVVLVLGRMAFGSPVEDLLMPQIRFWL